MTKHSIMLHFARRQSFKWLSLIILLFISNTGVAQQTLTPHYNTPMGTLVNGFYESLPAVYNSQPTTKFPLIITFHGSGEIGDGTNNATTGLPKVLNPGGTIPKRIQNNSFPDAVTVDGESFSFIVLMPQFTTQWTNANYTVNYFTVSQSINALIDYAKTQFRVDTNRIYITGLSFGARVSWYYSSYIESCNKKIAASAFVALANLDVRPGGLTTPLNTLGNSNLPTCFYHNTNDNTAPFVYSQALRDSLIARSVVPNPPLVAMTPTPASHDAWTAAYDPNYKYGGLNIYEWMLQYTNKKLTAKAGPDQNFTTIPSSVTLNGSKSHARQGRIQSYNWSKIAGPAATISSPAAAITNVTGLTNGNYQFRLTVTHTDNSASSDTVMVNITAPPPVANAGGIKNITLPQDTITLNGSASTYPPGSTITWTRDSGPTTVTISNPNSISTHVSGMTGVGKYTFRLTITNGTQSSTSYAFVYVQPVGQPLQAYAGPWTTVYLPLSSLPLDGSPSTRPTGTTALWEFYGGPTSVTIADPNTITTSASGTFAVGDYKFYLTLTAPGTGNKSHAWKVYYVRNTGSPRIVNPATSMRANVKQDVIIEDLTLAVNPNPVTNDLNLSLHGSVTGRVVAIIFDATGKKVLQQRFDKNSNSYIQNINVAKLAAGVYSLQVIINGKQTQSIRFVKQ